MQLPFPERMLSLDERIELTVSCRDADLLSRVATAGQVERDPTTGTRVQIMHNGIRVEADGYCGAWMTDLISRLRGVHEPQEEVVFDSLMKYLPDARTMIEIGSYWAYYTLWFLSLDSANRRALGLEMDPAHIAVGNVNAALNGLSMDVVQGRISSANTVAQVFETESSGPQKMPSFGLEGLMAECGFDRTDIVLCDAQGGEIDMLLGMKGLIESGRVGVVIISTHHHLITGDPLTHQRCLHSISQLGGRVALEHDVAESFSGDGLIVADFDGSLDGWTAPEISRCRTSRSLFRDPLYDLAAERECAARERARLEKDHAYETETLRREIANLQEQMAVRNNRSFLQKVLGNGRRG